MKRFKNMSRVCLVLFLTLTNCFLEYLIGSDYVCNHVLPLPMMPSKAKQKKIDAQHNAQCFMLRKNIDGALAEHQILRTLLTQNFRYIKFFNKQRCAMLLKKYHVICKKESALRDNRELVLQKELNEKELINAIRKNQWKKQASLRLKIELFQHLVSFSKQAVSKHSRQLELVQNQEHALQKKIVNLQKSIIQYEQRMDRLFIRAQRCAHQLINGSSARPERLFNALAPTNPLSEV